MKEGGAITVSQARNPMAKTAPLERFRAKWKPVRVKKTRQNKNLEPRSDSIGTEKALANELDANRFAAAPDHFAGASGPGVTRERQPQSGRQRIGIVDHEIRARRGEIFHHALARGKTAFERDPPGLMHRFARVALLGR